MADYPSSVVNLATNLDGDTIFAAIVNSIQDEVEAIETALLNGFQHDLLPLADSTYVLGSTTLRWSKLWADDITIGGILTSSGTQMSIRGVIYTFPAADGTSGSALVTDGSTNLSWTPVSSKPFVQWTAAGNQPPASAYATPDTRNSHLVLDFDGATDEEAVFCGVLPTSYAAGGLTCSTYWAFTSATSGSLRVQAGIERIDASSLDIDADSFAAFQSAGGTAPGTSGMVIKVDVTFTSGAQMDSLAAGEAFRLKIRRDADGTSGTDDIATDAELLRVVLRET